MTLLNKARKFFGYYNEKGIPLPVVRDPGTGRGSITATMVVVSFGVAVILLAGKAGAYFGDTDYDNVIWLLGVTISAYLGRRFQGSMRPKKVQKNDDEN